MNASGQDGITLGQGVLDGLRARLRGPLLRAGDAAYDESRSLWNGMIDRRPALVVRCLGTSDVVAGVAFAREHGLALAIKGGGHNVAGLAAGDGALMLDMSLMRGVWVDPQRRTARAQPGCLLGDLDRETQLHGLAAVMGFVSTTGIAGLTLGGGFGYLTRRFGWACDNVVSMDVVTADSRLVHASEDDNADLFWALRGGGGNCGVVTGFEYRLHPVGPEVVAGAIAWRIDDAPAVLAMYRTLVEQAPPELTCVVVLRRAPPAPWLLRQVHGELVVMLLVCDSGPVADAERRVAPIKAFGAPVGDIVQRRSYASQQSLVDATQPKGWRYHIKSDYLPRFEPALFEMALRHALRIGAPNSAIVLFPLDGAIGRLPEDHCAMGNRDAGAVFNVTAAWQAPEDDRANIDWARTAWADLRRFSTGGTYVNFLSEDEGDERIRSAYRGNYDRLVEVKTRWDPTNLLRINKNVVPRAS